MNYEEIGRKIGKLVAEKNKAYGNSHGESHRVLEVLYPDGVMPEEYIDMLTMIRVIDKLFRIANEKEAFGESPWRDVVGYGILGVSMEQDCELHDAGCTCADCLGLFMAKAGNHAPEVQLGDIKCECSTPGVCDQCDILEACEVRDDKD